MCIVANPSPCHSVVILDWTRSPTNELTEGMGLGWAGRGRTGAGEGSREELKQFEKRFDTAKRMDKYISTYLLEFHVL